MCAGPFMNLVLAVALFLVVLMGFGVQQQTTTVSSVSPCVISQSENRDTCKKTDPASPAAAAGMKAGDKIVAFDGRRTENWNTLSDLIRDSAGKTVPITVERSGHEVTLHAKIATNMVAKKDASGAYVQGEFVKAGFLGFSAATGVVRQDFGESLTWMGDRVGDAVDSLAALPAKIPALWDAAFHGAPRAPDSPMGVVGAARVGGEIFTLHIPPTQQLGMALMLVAGFNLSLFLFNMLPLLPLDGGHIAGALWEALRRNTAKVLRRPDPGPFDVAKLMPVAYVVAGIFICFTILVLIADVVNPVRIS
jgi:membrane-associated protease RseP (regulator of RpoE activity)